jgi:hypothetical protein
VDGLLALPPKQCKYGTVGNRGIGLCDIRNGLCSKAFNGVVSQVRGGGTVFGVLETADTACLRLAMPRSALEEMDRPPVVSLNSNILLEKRVDWRPPSSFQVICEHR